MRPQILQEVAEACRDCMLCRGRHQVFQEKVLDALGRECRIEIRRRPRPNYFVIGKLRAMQNDCEKACQREKPLIAERVDGAA